jgi:hypothetical protein
MTILPSPTDDPAGLFEGRGVESFCGCSTPDVVDRVCRACGHPNLVALLSWSVDGCQCPEPDNRVGPIVLRSCRRCDRTVIADLGNA